MEKLQISLGTIAYSRSGDKGANANIGVIAFKEEGYRFLEEYLTDQKVGDFFKGLHHHGVKRYLLPNLWALNFVIMGALAGGGSRSLRMDAQGKALGQAILEMKILIPEEVHK
jgi:hypothetical protein